MKKSENRGGFFFRKIYLTMVALHKSLYVSEIKKRNLRRNITS